MNQITKEYNKKLSKDLVAKAIIADNVPVEKWFRDEMIKSNQEFKVWLKE